MQKLRQIRIKLALIFKVFILFVLVFFASLSVYTYTRTTDSPTAYAATSSTLNFQGRLLNASGSIVPDGLYNLEFKIYDGGTNGGPAGTGEANAGTLLWTETRDFPATDDRVRIVNGYFSVNLGSVNPFSGINWDQELWLTMNVGGSTTTPSWDGEMLAPTNKRTKLTGVPYAFTAGQLLKTVGANKSILDFLSPTANRTINLPDQSGTLCIQGSANCVDVATTGTTATTSSNSGLEISADGLRLLGGCSANQILKWNNVSNIWQCSADNGSPLTVRESDSLPTNTSVTTLEFGPALISSDEFIVTDEGSGVSRIRVGNGVALLADNETVAGAWTYTTDQTFSFADTEDLAINLSTTGVSNSQAQTITLSNSSLLGSQYGLYVDNAASTGTTEALLVLDNSDADTAVTTAIQVINAGGGFTNLFDIAGTLISVSEFTLLDGKDAALVDQNDFISGDGVGAVSSGSGLESGTGGIGLLQGCANNEGLIWNDTTSIWGCSLPTLDTAYTNDTDRTLSVNDTSGLTFDLTTTGGLFIEDNNVVFASFTDTGGITFAPQNTSDILFTLDDDSNLNLTGTITNNGQLSDISFTLGNDTDADTVAGLRINATSAITGDADTLLGLFIANLNSASAVTESALQIGTGWDNDLVFNDSTAIITLGATNNTALLSVNDSAGNNLLELKDLSTNFGSYLEAGAVAFRNSYIGEEFNRDRIAVVADTTALIWGDDQAWNVDETNNSGDCSWNGVDDAVNGITQIQNIDVSAVCNTFYGGIAAGDMNQIFDADNLPVVMMKVRPSNVSANDDLWVGFQDATQLQVSDEPDQGIFFTNNGGTTWTGVTKTSDVNRTSVTCTGQTISTTQFGLVKAEVVSDTEVNFYVDNDVSNGVNFVLCGTATTTAHIPAVALGSMLKWSSTTANRFLQVDFHRVWQDDASLDVSSESIQSNEEELVEITSEQIDQSGSESLSLNEGVEFVDPLQEIRDRILALESRPTTVISSGDLDLSSVEVGSLTVIGEANFEDLVTFRNDITVLGRSTVQDLTVTLDLIIKGAIVVEGEATFKELVRFEKDVEFNGNVSLSGDLKASSDLVGRAKILKGEKSIKVTFTKPKSTEPVVTVSLGNGKFVQYSHRDITTEGFEIVISSPAPEDLEFSWVAIESIVTKEVSLD